MNHNRDWKSIINCFKISCSSVRFLPVEEEETGVEEDDKEDDGPGCKSDKYAIVEWGSAISPSQSSFPCACRCVSFSCISPMPNERERPEDNDGDDNPRGKADRADASDNESDRHDRRRTDPEDAVDEDWDDDDGKDGTVSPAAKTLDMGMLFWRRLLLMALDRWRPGIDAGRLGVLEFD